jgi:hypothetical protein
MEAKKNILGRNAQKLFNLEPVLSPVKQARLDARKAAALART